MKAHQTVPEPSHQPFTITSVPRGQLQRKCACGNTPGPTGECAACRRQPLGIQTKLIVNQPGDKYEQEADQVADQVMHMPEPRMQGQVAAEEEEELLQTKLLVPQRVAGNGSDSEAPPIVHEILRSPGHSLTPAARDFMESRFGHDFSRVRVHVDGQAIESAQAIGARAYTVGRNVVFGTGQYAPQTTEGQWLLAHELTHVVQQDGIFSESNETHMVQRAGDDICEIESTGVQEPTETVVYDYEGQVCRPAEPDELGVTIPERENIDGEFWLVPRGVRKGAKPIYDDEDTGVIVGYRYGSGGYYEIYDLTGNLVESGEPGLESPLIDPIDILAGGLTGLGRGLLRGGGRALARGVAGGAGRGTASSLIRTGLVATIKALSRRAATAIRGIYRAIRFRGALNFTVTTASRMADPARRVPHHILKLAIRFGQRSPDPQGVAGAFRYVIPMFRNGKEYTLEVVIREADKTVLHFLYR